jgi:hypothetical protein
MCFKRIYSKTEKKNRVNCKREKKRQGSRGFCGLMRFPKIYGGVGGI